MRAKDSLKGQLRGLASVSTKKLLTGVLGLSIGGNRVVDIATRPGFVYVRLRDNQSEVIQAHNSKVTPIYDLPVTLIFTGIRYEIVDRDVAKYGDWGTSSAFLPLHGGSHSLWEHGRDIVWVDSQQFMPALVYPSSLTEPTIGAFRFLYRNSSNQWVYSSTGTLDFSHSNMPNSTMYLVMMKDSDGSLYTLTGSNFLYTITGTPSLLPYIPVPPVTSFDIPLAAIKVGSGTPNNIQWGDIIDARQFVSSVVLTGSGGGGSAPSGPASGDLTGSYPNPTVVQATVSDSSHPFVVGGGLSSLVSTIYNRVLLLVFKSGLDALFSMAAIGSGVSNYIQTWVARGTTASPTKVLSGDTLLDIAAGGRYTGGWGQNGVDITAIAEEDWNDASHNGTRLEVQVKSTGTGPSILVDKIQGALRTFYTDVSLASHQIHSVVDPSSNQDVATKIYVDNKGGGLPTGSAFKHSENGDLYGNYPYPFVYKAQSSFIIGAETQVILSGSNMSIGYPIPTGASILGLIPNAGGPITIQGISRISLDDRLNGRILQIRHRAVLSTGSGVPITFVHEATGTSDARFCFPDGRNWQLNPSGTVTFIADSDPTQDPRGSWFPISSYVPNHSHGDTVGNPGGTLLQINTHNSPDTDSANSSIHHTIGTGTFQAASGLINTGDNARDSGWIPIITGSWSYLSGTMVTTAVGAASIYNVGDKYKKIQNSTGSYGYIVGVTNTTLTLCDGTTAPVSNTAISAVYISKSSTPVGFPAYFNTPSVSFLTAYLDNGTPGVAIVSTASRFTILGNKFEYFVTVPASVKNTLGNFVAFNLPTVLPVISIPGAGGGVFGTINVPFNITVVTGVAYLMTANNIADNANIAAGGFGMSALF